MHQCGLWLIGALVHPAGLTENCRGCATQSLQFLKDLKAKTTLQRADPASIRIVIQKILHLGQVRETTLHSNPVLNQVNQVKTLFAKRAAENLQQ